MTELRIGAPNEKQRRFLLDRHRHIAYGGARGGGKSCCAGWVMSPQNWRILRTAPCAGIPAGRTAGCAGV